MIVVAVDIGSTWTKGAAFAVDADEHVRLLDRAACPTTVHDLEEGFMHVFRALVPDDPLGRLRNGALRLQYSSSAKGGLAVAAIGLVSMGVLLEFVQGAATTYRMADPADALANALGVALGLSTALSPWRDALLRWSGGRG